MTSPLSLVKIIQCDLGLGFLLVLILYSSNFSSHIFHVTLNLGGQSSIVVKYLHCNDKDVGSNHTATRNEKRTLGGRPTEGSTMV